MLWERDKRNVRLYGILEDLKKEEKIPEKTLKIVNFPK